MAKEYSLHFGPTFLSATSGLSPTFTSFVRLDTGATLPPPGITQIVPGLGMYKFAYTPTMPIYFEIDGATTGLGIYRYIQGQLDPNDLLNEQVGTTASSFGDAVTDASTLYGFLKRIQQYLEGNSNYAKASGLWTVFDKSGGTTLVVKTLTDSASTVTKT